MLKTTISSAYDSDVSSSFHVLLGYRQARLEALAVLGEEYHLQNVRHIDCKQLVKSSFLMREVATENHPVRI